ncbi:hypothetical protein C7441_105295 [Pseudaminobacter salicylatoxidans]|uniref:Methyltransferase domain-containing protein n=1 Tax=Pseudaminobacter salicylatoxidans TaxID=93369 RepID=A0A316C4L3_PSESE|nr:class I SAM-dependent methyltransferase [Pseudaminobacter salicylatoxidans]PWJ84675.1 hypothetical protein C7441_105295 [Pseudaminobacter salicylatoxidans]
MFSRFLDDIENYSSNAGMYLDVPFVPSDENVVDAMLEMANVGPKDVLYDLGSGDGRILVSAAKQWGTRGIGIDIDPQRIAEAVEYAGWSQVEDIVEFIEDDIFAAEFSEATAVTLYLLQSINVQLRPRILSELRAGTRVVSHAFDMGDWKADECRKIGGVNIYKWIVPAQVEGIWEWERAGRQYRIDLQQSYQEVSGDAWLDGKRVRLSSAELLGRKLKIEIQEAGATRTRSSFTLAFLNNRLQSVMTHAGR